MVVRINCGELIAAQTLQYLENSVTSLFFHPLNQEIFFNKGSIFFLISAVISGLLENQEYSLC